MVNLNKKSALGDFLFILKENEEKINDSTAHASTSSCALKIKLKKEAFSSFIWTEVIKTVPSGPVKG